MVEILRFIRPDTVFDAEATSALIAAYEQAIAHLHDSGQLVREVIAKKIIARAMKGERDPNRLCASVLASIGLPTKDTR
jgi:hypothetical protein